MHDDRDDYGDGDGGAVGGNDDAASTVSDQVVVVMVTARRWESLWGVTTPSPKP